MDKININNWKPKESEKDKIVNELYDFYLTVLDNCGNDTEAQEAFNLYMKVKNNPIHKCKSDIQSFFTDCYYAVKGNIEQYYKDSPQLIELIRLTII